jgi:hypothetical protein
MDNQYNIDIFKIRLKELAAEDFELALQYIRKHIKNNALSYRQYLSIKSEYEYHRREDMQNLISKEEKTLFTSALLNKMIILADTIKPFELISPVYLDITHIEALNYLEQHKKEISEIEQKNMALQSKIERLEKELSLSQERQAHFREICVTKGYTEIAKEWQEKYYDLWRRKERGEVVERLNLELEICIEAREKLEFKLQQILPNPSSVCQTCKGKGKNSILDTALLSILYRCSYCNGSGKQISFVSISYDIDKLNKYTNIIEAMKKFLFRK